jgi:hypothetical protein
MKRRSDEDYIDHWLLHVIGGTVEVDEETKNKVRKAIDVNTVAVRTDHGVVLQVQQVFFDIIDLMGAETSLRLDEVKLITHWTPEWRDNYKAFQKAKDDGEEKKDWE